MNLHKLMKLHKNYSWLCQKRQNNSHFLILAKRHYTKQWKKTKIAMSEIRNSRAPGATSRVILELKPFEISIRGPIGSEPSVGRNTGKMSRNSIL